MHRHPAAHTIIASQFFFVVVVLLLCKLNNADKLQAVQQSLSPVPPSNPLLVLVKFRWKTRDWYFSVSPLANFQKIQEILTCFQVSGRWLPNP